MSEEDGRTARRSRGKSRSEPDTGSSAERANPSCPTVGVGASAGGLDAFTRLLRALPARIGMALVMVQHLDPTQESMLADILGRESKMPVTEAADGMRVEADHVYVIPPNSTMRISGGKLILQKRPKPPAQVLPIDTFLRSLADECADLSVGVVLSGTGSDGLLGLTAIRAANGLAFAQDPETAEYGGMPRASADAGVAALVKNTTRALAYENDSAAAVIAKVNAVIFKATPTSVFVTLVFCVLDTATGRLAYCSAGHTRSMLKRMAGGVDLLDVGSSLIGAFESAQFAEGETTLEKGDILVLYTDGVTEARQDRVLFGEERLVEFVRQMGPTPPKRVPKTVFDEVLRYSGGKLSDDVAIVAVARSDGGRGGGRVGTAAGRKRAGTTS